jgi:hypothetical protein
MSSRPARNQNEISTPAVKTRPWEKIFQRDWPARFTKSKILSESTGSTHGMRLRMSPPVKASRSMSRSFTKPDWADPSPDSEAAPGMGAGPDSEPAGEVAEVVEVVAAGDFGVEEV